MGTTEAGTTYSPARKAAKCPACSTWVKKSRTLPWDFDLGMCTRRHRCGSCGYTFKSIEEDPTLARVPAGTAPSVLS